MDTSREYIEMCEKAKEIQAINNETGYQLGNFYICEDGLFVYDGHNNLEIWEDFNDSKAIWLPRQDQLQEMMSHKELPQVALYLRLAKYIEVHIYYWQFKSMEQLWLACVMRERFGKTWNETEWIKKD